MVSRGFHQPSHGGETIMGIKRYEKQAEHIKAERLYKAASDAWIRANNGGSDAVWTITEDRIDQLCKQALGELTKVHGCDLAVHFPGLHPCFKLNGQEYHSVDSLAQWAPRAAQA